jgi:predicted GNAT family N-acyltransferase
MSSTEAEAAAPLLQRAYSVTLEDGTDVNYTLRGLEALELTAWTELCASVFADKASPPPPSYFARHFYNDPYREVSYIRVAVHKDVLVASVRMFVRTISNGHGGYYRAGGIGEVGTDAHHRRRGLSQALLKDALQIMMHNHAHLQVSLLHAAPAYFPVYASAGYHHVTTQWSCVNVSVPSLLFQEANLLPITCRIRLAQFPQDTPALSHIHRTFSEQRWAGCILRSEEYWNDYISHEIGDSLYVMEDQAVVDTTTTTTESRIRGWMSLRFRNQRYQVQEFGCGCDEHDPNEEASHVSVRRVFLSLLQHELLRLPDVAHQETIPLLIPTAILDSIQHEHHSTTHHWETDTVVQWQSVAQETDQGWMYKNLDPNNDIAKHIQECQHFIWPSDSF